MPTTASGWKRWRGMVAAKGASTATELQRYHDAWDRAADRTPHGQPIALQPSDFTP